MNAASAAATPPELGELRELPELRERVAGQLLLPSDEGFDAGCAGFQTAYRHRPAVLVRAAGADDVAAAVGYADRHGLPVAAQATGHGLAVPADGGVLVDTSALAGVDVDPAARTAWVGAGTTFADVIDATARYGLAPLNGSSPGVGAVGYVLGGGLGILARQFGYAADHVYALDLVQADGRALRVTGDSDPELFWAMRGAGANFGIVTGMQIGLVPVTRIYGGELTFDVPTTPGVLETYRRWTADLPEELTSSISLIAYPDLPMLPEHLRGRHLAQVRIAYTGDARDGAELVAPLRDAGPESDTVAEMPYTECGDIYDDPAQPHAYLGDNVLLADLGPESSTVLTELSGPGAPLPCIVDVRHLGGALGRAPAVPNAVGHRDARYLVRVLSPLLGDEQDQARAAQRKLLDAVSATATPLGRCHNLVYGGCETGTDSTGGTDGTNSSDSTDGAARGFWEPADLRRLTRLKAELDPHNLFRCNRNIPPAHST